jgi:hypothetical protein
MLCTNKVIITLQITSFVFLLQYISQVTYLFPVKKKLLVFYSYFLEVKLTYKITSNVPNATQNKSFNAAQYLWISAILIIIIS